MEHGTQIWQQELKSRFKQINLLDGDDLDVYLVLLQSQQDMLGSELVDQLPNLKRTHVYSILTRLQQEGWINISNPGKRPAQYKANDPLKLVETRKSILKSQVTQLEEFEHYIKTEIHPVLSRQNLFPSRITNTYIIPSIRDLETQIIEQLNASQVRIMAHVNEETLRHFQTPILRNINRLIKNYKQEGLRLTPDYIMAHFSITTAGNAQDQQLIEQFPNWTLAWELGALQTEIVVIDNITFISNISPTYNLGLRIEDSTVASTYAELFSNLLLERRVEMFATHKLDILGIRYQENSAIKNAIQRLVEKGWRIVPDHTESVGPNLGLVAPGSGRLTYRLCGLQYFHYPPKTSKKRFLQEIFANAIIQTNEAMKRIEQRATSTAKQGEGTFFEQDCLTYEVTLKLRADWQAMLPTFSEQFKQGQMELDILVLTFEYNESGVMNITAMDRNNTLQIMKEMIETRQSSALK